MQSLKGWYDFRKVTYRECKTPSFDMFRKLKYILFLFRGYAAALCRWSGDQAAAYAVTGVGLRVNWEHFSGASVPFSGASVPL